MAPWIDVDFKLKAAYFKRYHWTMPSCFRFLCSLLKPSLKFFCCRNIIFKQTMDLYWLQYMVTMISLLLLLIQILP